MHDSDYYLESANLELVENRNRFFTMHNQFFEQGSVESELNTDFDESTPISVMHLQRFLQATRDAGYKSVESALSELVDNSLQAEASRIEIALRTSTNSSSGENYQILIWDDGRGMSRFDLEAALQFGGSSRFNDREGMGRYGMGLPNSSLSQARRVDIWSWRAGIDGERRYYHVCLDLDQLLTSTTPYILSPRVCPHDEVAGVLRQHKFFVPNSSHGTLILWSRIDRITKTTWVTLPKRLHTRLGQRFRYFLWSGRTLRCDGQEILPFDPLYLDPCSLVTQFQASEFIEPIQVSMNPLIGIDADIQIRFSILPVSRIADWPVKDKRAAGIIGGSGASIVRADREIDYGWFFFDKRRENYDDWWRCEIKFPPVLDEIFGVNHTKQGIRPSDELRALLAREIGGIARELNRMVQFEHQLHARRRRELAMGELAAKCDVYLKPLASAKSNSVLASACKTHEQGEVENSLSFTTNLDYEFNITSLENKRFIDICRQGEKLIISLNQHHEFYLQIWKPLSDREPHLAQAMELCFFGLARATVGTGDQQNVEALLTDWSRAMSVFLRGLH